MLPRKRYTISLEVRGPDGHHVASTTREIRTGTSGTTLGSFLIRQLNNLLLVHAMNEDAEEDSSRSVHLGEGEG